MKALSTPIPVVTEHLMKQFNLLAASRRGFFASVPIPEKPYGKEIRIRGGIAAVIGKWLRDVGDDYVWLWDTAIGELKQIDKPDLPIRLEDLFQARDRVVISANHLLPAIDYVGKLYEVGASSARRRELFTRTAKTTTRDNKVILSSSSPHHINRLVFTNRFIRIWNEHVAKCGGLLEKQLYTDGLHKDVLAFVASFQKPEHGEEHLRGFLEDVQNNSIFNGKESIDGWVPNLHSLLHPWPTGRVIDRYYDESYISWEVRT